MLYRVDRTLSDAALQDLALAVGARFQTPVTILRTARAKGLRLGGAAAAPRAESLASDGLIEVAWPSGRPYILASSDFQQEKTLVSVRGAVFGGEQVPLIAGPCSVESERGLREAAAAVADAGATLLRAGAFKPRTSPWAFQGLGVSGLQILRRVADEFGLAVVTEVMAPEDVPLVAEWADVLQVGSRNAQNFPLLRAVGRARRPVLLKRGMMARIDEFLAAADYVLAEGNSEVILCERGIRGFDPMTRNVLDVVAVPLLQALSHLPVIVDPSHGCGRHDLVPAAARAALAAGADGLMIEVHTEPATSVSDPDQALDPQTFRSLVADLKRLALALDRCL